MSGSTIILRDKRRFAMYLSLAAATSLWIIPVDWAAIDWTLILAGPILEGGAISFFIAAILYEWRPDEKLDKHRASKVIKEIMPCIALIDVLFAPWTSTSWVSVEEDCGNSVDQVMDSADIKSTLWDAKIGIATGLTVLIAVIRFTAFSLDTLVSAFDPVTPAIIALGITTGLSVMYLTVHRDEYKDFTQKVADLAIRQWIIDAIDGFELIRNRKQRELGDPKKKLSEDDDEKETLTKWIERIANNLKEECNDMRSLIDSDRWSMFKREIERLVRQLAIKVQSPNMKSYLFSTLSNSYLRAYCELDYSHLKDFINSVQDAISMVYRKDKLKDLGKWMNYMRTEPESETGKIESKSGLFEFICYDRLEQQVWKELELFVEMMDPGIDLGLDFDSIRTVLKRTNPKKAESIEPILSNLEANQRKFK